jgi:branched-chain amino acid transport system substrate-binding protein
MNINSKLVISVSTLALLATSLTSCFVSEPKATEPNANPITSSEKSTKVKVIGLFPLTGPGASLGDYLKNGVQLAKEDAQKKYPGIDLNIQLIDSKNQPKEGISALQSATISSAPDVLISGMSSVSKAVIPVVEQKNIPTIVTTTALSNLPQGTKNVIRMYPTSEDFVEPVANHMAKKLDKIAVLYVNDDFGKRNQEVFINTIKKAGKAITAAEPFELAQPDSRATIAKVLATNPKAIFVTGYGPSFINIFKQLREANKSIPIYTEIGFANPAVLTALGSTAEGIIFDGTEMELSQPSTPAVASFKTSYESKFKVAPYQVAGFAYDSISLIAQAKMKEGGSGKIDKSGMIALSPFQGVMGTITLDSQGESRIKLQLMKRVGGKTVKLAE